MPGTITFRPIEANLNQDTDIIGKADPYCMFTVGGQKIKGPVCKSGGIHPVWNEAVTISTADQPSVLLEVKDKEILKDDKMGSVEIDLHQIESHGEIRAWFPLYNKNQTAGEILLEAVYNPDIKSQSMGRQTGILHTGTPIGTPVVINSPTVVTQGTHFTREATFGTQSNVIYPEPQTTQLSGGYIPSATYTTMSPGYTSQYAQEAVIRGADPYGTQLQKSQPIIRNNNLSSIMPLPRIESDKSAQGLDSGNYGFTAHNYGSTGTHYHSQNRQSRQMVFGHGRAPMNP
jgi:hypothetical protein